MKLLFRGAACAPLLALLAGCCANNANDCNDLQADSLYLVLPDNTANSDTVNVSFTRAELDTVYLQRYAPPMPAKKANGTIPASLPQPAGPLSDPVSIIRAKQTQATLNSALYKILQNASPKLLPTTLVISNTAPFQPSTTGGKLSAYRYLLTVQDKPVKPGHTYQFNVDSIQFKGQYNADGCNTCYQNTYKYFEVNKRKLVRDVTETSGPIATQLTKKEAVIK